MPSASPVPCSESHSLAETFVISGAHRDAHPGAIPGNDLFEVESHLVRLRFPGVGLPMSKRTRDVAVQVPHAGAVRKLVRSDSVPTVPGQFTNRRLPQAGVASSWHGPLLAQMDKGPPPAHGARPRPRSLASTRPGHSPCDFAEVTLVDEVNGLDAGLSVGKPRRRDSTYCHAHIRRHRARPCPPLTLSESSGPSLALSNSRSRRFLLPETAPLVVLAFPVPHGCI